MHFNYQNFILTDFLSRSNLYGEISIITRTPWEHYDITVSIQVTVFDFAYQLRLMTTDRNQAITLNGEQT